MTNLADLLNEAPTPIQRAKDAAKEILRRSERRRVNELLESALRGLPEEAQRDLAPFCKPHPTRSRLEISLPGHRRIRWWRFGDCESSWNYRCYWVGGWGGSSHNTIAEALVAAEK